MRRPENSFNPLNPLGWAKMGGKEHTRALQCCFVVCLRIEPSLSPDLFPPTPTGNFLAGQARKGMMMTAAGGLVFAIIYMSIIFG